MTEAHIRKRRFKPPIKWVRSGVFMAVYGEIDDYCYKRINQMLNFGAARTNVVFYYEHF